MSNTIKNAWSGIVVCLVKIHAKFRITKNFMWSHYVTSSGIKLHVHQRGSFEDVLEVSRLRLGAYGLMFTSKHNSKYSTSILMFLIEIKTPTSSGSYLIDRPYSRTGSTWCSQKRKRISNILKVYMKQSAVLSDTKECLNVCVTTFTDFYFRVSLLKYFKLFEKGDVNNLTSCILTPFTYKETSMNVWYLCFHKMKLFKQNVMEAAKVLPVIEKFKKNEMWIDHLEQKINNLFRVDENSNEQLFNVVNNTKG